nr:ABC transporter substrate-binding protein [Rhodoferax koreense]
MALATGLGLVPAANAQPRYDPGASATEIRIGNTMPYSGPVSAFGTVGKAEAAYFDMVNAEGGINGRKISFITLDDGYVPSKTVERVRKLVEQDEVLAVFGLVGTSHNAAVQKYLNARKVPQLFISTGATRFGDPKNFPWTMGWQPTYQAEGRIYAQHILASNPNAKIAILYQNDDFGRDVLKGVMNGLGEKAQGQVVAQTTYETTDPTVDSQVVSLKASGADTFINIATPKAAAQAIRKAADIGWKPAQYVTQVSNSVPMVMKPAGPENALGVISIAYVRDPADPAWQASKEYLQYQAWFRKYYPGGNIEDPSNVIGYSMAQTLAQTLKQAGDNLTRENVMKQAANLDMTLPMLLPGVAIKTGPNDFAPVKGMQPVRFNGKVFEPFGPVLNGQ